MGKERINIAIVGWGNVGKGVYRSIDNFSWLSSWSRNNDMNVAAIGTRRPEKVTREIERLINLDNFQSDQAPAPRAPLVFHPDNIKQLEVLERAIDVAILCGGSKNDLPRQGPELVRYFNTVDSFDTHADIPEYFIRMNSHANGFGHVAVISAGWDPGTFSLERVLGDAFIPGTVPHGFYGLTKRGGLSMGHSDAARQVKGVKDARSYTHAIPKTIRRAREGATTIEPREMHRREVYVVLEKGVDEEKVRQEIVNMPNYFAPYKTVVKFISEEEMKRKHSKMPHNGVVIVSGKTGQGANNSALIEYRNQWESNPEATGNILVACARAAYRLKKDGKTGAFTMLNIPPAYYSIHSREELLKDFM